MPCKDCPPSTRLEATKPKYMNTTSATTKMAPMDPNCPRLCTICGTPSCGPCAACSAMKMPPTRFPTRIARLAATKDS